MKRDRPPPPIVMKTPRGLSPVAAYDQELILSDAHGTQYDLVKRTRRSLPQLGMYWATLASVVKATGKWPTSAHLHDDLKLVCGYRRKVIDWTTGEVAIAVDSIAFEAMTADEFRVYFDHAMAKLAEHLGYDPLAYQVAA